MSSSAGRMMMVENRSVSNRLPWLSSTQLAGRSARPRSNGTRPRRKLSSMPSAPVKATSPKLARRPGSSRKVTSIRRASWSTTTSRSPVAASAKPAVARPAQELGLGVDHRLGARGLVRDEPELGRDRGGEPVRVVAERRRRRRRSCSAARARPRSGRPPAAAASVRRPTTPAALGTVGRRRARSSPGRRSSPPRAAPAAGARRRASARCRMPSRLSGGSARCRSVSATPRQEAWPARAAAPRGSATA